MILKRITTISICCLFFSSLLLAQQDKCQNCPRYQSFMQSGMDFLKDSLYDQAITEFRAAQVAARVCDCSSTAPSEAIVKAVEGIQQQKADALAAQKRAEQAERKAKRAETQARRAQTTAEQNLALAKAAKAEAQTNLAKANKLVNAFYFYANRFALAYGRNEKTSYREKFYFIDKNGDIEEKLGQWDKAEQFDYTGYAKITDGVTNFLLDTLGNKYPVAYTLENLNSTITALDLRNTQLDSFPQIVMQHTPLQILLLESNQLSTLPAEIGQLQNLTSLYLINNQLSTLPAEIVQLQNLTSLDLSYNQLSTLPAEIGQLQNLTSLDLINNQLSTLPAEIGQLQNLTSLDLSYNQLSTLPAEIVQLQNLTSLYLHSNDSIDLTDLFLGLKDFPKNITITSNSYARSKANELTIIIPKIKHLPAEIGQLQNLTSLDLRSNQLSTLPAEIGQLQNLTSLDLSDNQLSTLPAEIGQLQNLTSLYLSDNQLSTLPAEIGQLQNLTSLYLSDNPLDSLSASFFELKVAHVIDYENLLESCLGNKNYGLALFIRKGIQNWALRHFSLNNYFSFSWDLVNCKDFEGAIWAGERYVQAGGRDVGALSNLGMGYLYHGDYDKAFTLYQENAKKGKATFLKDLKDTAEVVPSERQAEVERMKAYLESLELEEE